jgi:hypothetical protein
LFEKICLQQETRYLSVTKLLPMKKIVTVLVMTAALTACNGNGGSANKMDSVVSDAADSAKTAIDSAAMKVDSTIKAAADTTKAKLSDAVDSARKAVGK